MCEIFFLAKNLTHEGGWEFPAGKWGVIELRGRGFWLTIGVFCGRCRFFCWVFIMRWNLRVHRVR